MCYNVFGQNPLIMQKMKNLDNFNLDNYDKEAQKLASKIMDEQIRFEGIIPDCYLRNKSVFESIVAVNPKLLEKRENRWNLDTFTKNMAEQEVLDYYKKLGVPFNRETVIYKNMLSVLECLKNDHMTLSDTYTQYTKEEYQAMYEAIKDEIEPEEILESRFLNQNPYFVRDLIKSGVDFSSINLQDTKYYDEFYLGLRAVAIKSGVSIPEPQKYEDIIKVTDDNKVYIELDNLESIEKALEYLKKEGIDQDLLIELEQEKFNEFIITDNIEFFENLHKNNININFKYDNGEKEFSLKQVLDDEHFLQKAAEDIKSKNFSPLEELIAIYDIAKVFKPYSKENDRFSAKSRSVYEYLDNEYMVCAGYADLICNLGHRVGARCSKIRLDTTKEGHVRNYANIVDPKYGIDGYYAMDATWEQDGKLKVGRYEQLRSTYEDFLLTTEEGRNNAETGVQIKVDSYDKIFTCQTPEELRQADSKTSNRVIEQIRVLDPEFYKTIQGFDLKKDDYANVILDYLKSKINNPVSKEALLDAVINVKKSIYLNFSEKDFEDMRMGYSVLPPFCIPAETFWEENQSLYGREYDLYAERRYNDIKLGTIEEAKQNNKALFVNHILQNKKRKILKDDKIFSKYSSGNSTTVNAPEYIELLVQNKDKIDGLGIKVELFDDEEFDLHYATVNFPDDDRNSSIEQQMSNLENYKKQLYIAIGLEKETSQTQNLGAQTIEQQNDTRGKSEVKNEISRQLQNEKIQECEIIE